MLIRLTEVVKSNYQSGRQYSLREIFVNPSSITMIASDSQTKTHLEEGLLPEGIDDRADFSRVSINTGGHHTSLVAVGAPEIIESKLRNSRQLLKG